MNSQTIRALSILSRAEALAAQIDWTEVRRIVWRGLLAFVAGVILCATYSEDGIRALYRWAQPRLAALLGHPGQTLRHGPAALYGESVVAVLTGTATPLERVAVAVGAWVILRAGEAAAAVATVRRWRDGLTVEAVEAWALAQLGR
jgi:hypothetical protein